MGRNRKDGTLISCKINSELLDSFDSAVSASGRNRTAAIEEAMGAYVSFYGDYSDDQVFRASFAPPDAPEQECIIEDLDGDMYKVRLLTGTRWVPVSMTEVKVTLPQYDKELDTFRSEMSHELKRYGDLGLIDRIVKTDAVSLMLSSRNEPEALYLVSLADYLCQRNGLDPFPCFDGLRDRRLPAPLYPYSSVLRYRLSGDPGIFIRLRNKAIKEFLSHNIIEGEIDDVC